MSRAPLVLSLTALAAAVAAVALPAGATPPGTNGKLVFERPTRDGADLYTVGADGSGLTQLTRLEGLEGDSSWSPDGSQVAFTRARNPEEGPYEIWVVNADGSGLKRLTRHGGFSMPRPGRRTGPRSCTRPARAPARAPSICGSLS